MTASRPAESTRPLPHLPEPRHLARIPPGVSPEDFERVRRAAHQLPQVTKPADYLEPHAPRFEAHLDELGLILLQKAAGTRPSRWIEPRLVPLALAQLEATGTGPEVRALLNDRAAALETLGLVRHAGAFTRLVQDTLQVEIPDEDAPFVVTLPFRVAVDDAPVWAFYRDADQERLRAALGPAPRHPQRDAITAHLARLVARSAALSTRELASLLPRLQAECARPQRAEELMAACTRVQDRWEYRVTELDTLQGLTSELAFQGYPDTFPKARTQQRTVKLYVGPPNSGKTHAAFERLCQARDGAYLAPLRLLALEGRDRMVGRGVACSLLTGEENVPAEGARFVSSTIEMVSTNQPVEVAVVDEAQMIFDGSRGWAWTQAIVAVPASELIIICSDYAVPAIENLLGVCGESCTVRRFERKQHVELLPRPVALDALQTGDAVVAFSRRDVLTLRDAIAANGRAVSVIYGALPPEVRRREAERFASGESQILVATDAIGMGLNLPIRRVLFSTLTKFDGVGDRLLDESEVHQIAGRAGRFGMQEEGFTGVLDLAEPTAARTLKELLLRQPKAPRHFKAPVAPNGWHVRTISERLQASRLRDVLGVFVDRLKLDDAHFAVAELDAMLALAEQLDHAAGALPLAGRFIYAQAPVDTRSEDALQEYLDWARNHARGGRAGRPSFLDSVDGWSRLDRIEQALRACTLWLWLDLRFPGVFGLVEEVQALRAQLNDGIERQLQGKRPLAQMRRARKGGGPHR
ncbi:helicase [Rubrivivax gelatinosus]|uniref:Helicase n=1 Tax=Rubrivivax gelatinosus TaxID=28068 RepID=A0ABS1DXP4_RUBGE|nr:helicase-related protein [Rubrivivax gelatinosus]MBK1613558.1 helicase [Rubrivivax gelatinosus]MBK1714139.1 helicase [Rubrivivax gelatinosus]